MLAVPRISGPRRILVVKLADLGDLLLCEPALRSLRAAYPAAQLDLLASPASAALVPLLGHDAINVITFPKQLFDDPRGLLDPRHAMLPARLAWRLRRARYDQFVLLHHLTTPFGARKFRALAATCGAPHVAGLDNGRGAEAVAGGDSFIGHLAAALDRPLVAIFGPSNDDAWKPYGATRADDDVTARRLVVRQDLPCAPCFYTGFALGRPAGCPTRSCLTTLPVARVAAAERVVRQEA
jgi:ADP-heptose:LPS heptosyltransferase